MMQFELTLNFDYGDTTVRLKKFNQANKFCYHLNNDSDWLLPLHGNAYTKWSGDSV